MGAGLAVVSAHGAVPRIGPVVGSACLDCVRLPGASALTQEEVESLGSPGELSVLYRVVCACAHQGMLLTPPSCALTKRV